MFSPMTRMVSKSACSSADLIASRSFLLLARNAGTRSDISASTLTTIRFCTAIQPPLCAAPAAYQCFQLVLIHDREPAVARVASAAAHVFPALADRPAPDVEQHGAAGNAFLVAHDFALRVGARRIPDGLCPHPGAARITYRLRVADDVSIGVDQVASAVRLIVRRRSASRGKQACGEHCGLDRHFRYPFQG